MWRARPLSASRFGRSTRSTGNCLRQQLIDEETREPVPPEHKGRGYEVAKGQYLVVEDAELDAIEIESTHTIEIDSFVPRAQVDQRFFDTPYYVTPSEPVGQEAFAVIREAMRGKGMVALGRLVLSKRERVIALQAYGKGLLGTTLRYPMRCARPRITSAICRLAQVTAPIIRLPMKIRRQCGRCGDFNSVLVEPGQAVPRNRRVANPIRLPAPGTCRALLARSSVSAEMRLTL
jgi:Ku protein